MHLSSSLSRVVRLRADLPVPHTLRLWRVDATHGSLAWPGADWPAPAEWDALAAADHLGEAAEPRVVAPGAEIVLDLPNPGIAFLDLRPVG